MSYWSADRLLGKRYTFVDRESPDVTIVALDAARNSVRLHCIGGDRQWFPLDAFVDGIKAGALVESEAPPFVHERISRFDTKRSGFRMYVAGPNKRPMKGIN